MTTASETFRVGLIQMRSGRTPAANADAAIQLIRDAKAAGRRFTCRRREMTNIMEV